MIIKNWQDVEPKVRKQAAIEWVMMLGNNSSRPDESQKDKLKSHKYISRIWLQPGMVLEPDGHLEEEEIFHIVSGVGRAIVLGRSYVLKNGDTAYFAVGATYQVFNDGLEPLELIALGADVKQTDVKQEGLKDRGIVVKNWRDCMPWLSVSVHGYGIDWRIMTPTGGQKGMLAKSPEDKECQCLRTIKFYSFAMLQPSKAYSPHGHSHEEVYYIIKGRGTIRAFFEDNKTEDFCLRSGDVIVTPVGEKHQLINDGSEDIEFIAWGAPME